MNEVINFRPLGIQEQHFHQRLRLIRGARGLTQADLANKSGIHVGAIAHFESGVRLPSYENLRRLVAALSCTADYLLGFSDGRCEDAYRRGAFDAVEAMKSATKDLRLGIRPVAEGRSKPAEGEASHEPNTRYDNTTNESPGEAHTAPKETDT